MLSFRRVSEELSAVCRLRWVSRCFTKPANQIAESEAHMKNADIRLAVFKVMCLAAKSHGHSFSL